jgi:hypothetical protein
MQAEQMAMGIQQQQEQMEQMKEQQEQQQAMEEQMAEEGEEMPPEGMMPAEGEAIQAMLKAYKPPSQRKFKGRTGGVTPDWHDKSPDEERDIDEYAEARSKKNELTLSKSWVESLNDKGFTSPIIKEVNPDMSQMWFSQGGIDYVAMLSPTGVTHVEKATFADPTRYSRVQQEKPKATKPTEIEIDE